MDDNVIITSVLGILATIVSSWSTWFYTRRKYNSEVENSVIQNMQDSLAFYKALSDDNKARLELLQQENSDLRKQVDELKTQMMDLMAQICLNVSCNNRIPSKKTRNVSNGKTNSKEE